MRQWLRSLTVGLGLWGALLGFAGRVHAASSGDAVVTVSPVADVSLSLTVTTYAFGPLAVNTSSNSATAIRVTNNGQVNVTIDKRITNESAPSGWTAGTSAGLNTYVLYAATSTARVGLGSFTAATQFGALSNVSFLTGSSGSIPVVPVSGATPYVDVWFKLDMPTAVSSSTGRTITVRFTGISQ